MHPRESIPNVGRRAQGRKAVFVLKGSKVKDKGGDDGGSGGGGNGGTLTGVKLRHKSDKRQPSLSDSVAMYRDAAGEFSDGSDLSVWNHPYNRIIQRIMERRQVVHGHRYNSNLTPREADQEDYHNAAKATAYSHSQHSDDLSLLHHRTSQGPDRHRPAERKRRTDTTHSIERTRKDAEPHWQSSTERNAGRVPEGNQRQHRKHSPPEDLQPVALSYDPASGGFIARSGRVSPPQPSHRHYGYGDFGLRPSKSPAPLDTARSDPGPDAMSERLARIAAGRKRESDPMDELLDYMWVYQGMGRQVLNLGLPRPAWDSRRLFRKHKKLPPILQGIVPPNAAGQDNPRDEPSSARGESHGTEDSAEGVFQSAERRANSDPYVLASKHPAFAARSSFETRSGSEERGRRGGSADLDMVNVEDDDGQMFYNPASRGQVSVVDNGPHGPVRLIVKMPAMLPPELTRYSDMFDKD